MRSYYPNPLSTEEILDKVGSKKESNNWAYGGLSYLAEKKGLILGLPLQVILNF